MFFRTSPVWSAREEEIKSNKAYFGMISSAGLVLQEKKKKEPHTHRTLHSSLELSDLTVLSVFILLSDLCIPRHLLNCFFHFPSLLHLTAPSWWASPTPQQISFKQGRMKTGEEALQWLLCHLTDWMGPLGEKKKKERRGKKAQRKECHWKFTC